MDFSLQSEVKEHQIIRTSASECSPEASNVKRCVTFGFKRFSIHSRNQTDLLRENNHLRIQAYLPRNAGRQVLNDNPVIGPGGWAILLHPIGSPTPITTSTITTISSRTSGVLNRDPKDIIQLLKKIKFYFKQQTYFSPRSFWPFNSYTASSASL